VGRRRLAKPPARKAAHPNARFYPRPPRNVRPSIRTGKTRTGVADIAPSSLAARRATTDAAGFISHSIGALASISAPTMGSEMTAGGPRAPSAKLRRDSNGHAAFLRLITWVITFRHWIRMQRSLTETPRIFHVNWFRKRCRRGISCGRGSAKTMARF